MNHGDGDFDTMNHGDGDFDTMMGARKGWFSKTYSIGIILFESRDNPFFYRRIVCFFANVMANSNTKKNKI